MSRLKTALHATVRPVSVNDGEPRTLTWIHGYTMSSEIWTDVWDLLPEYSHVGVDLWGHGKSPHFPQSATLRSLAEAVVDAMVKHDSRDLIGLGFGSQVALEAALIDDTALDSLILGAPTIAGRSDSPEGATRMRELMLMHHLGADHALLAERWMQNPPEIFTGARKHPYLFARLRSIIEQHSWSEVSSGAMARLQRSSHDDRDLAAITARTLALVGEHDMPQFVRNGATLQRVVHGTTVVQIANTGHLPLIEDPAQCVLVIRAFLASEEITDA